jgi:hypothetical protein
MTPMKMTSGTKILKDQPMAQQAKTPEEAMAGVAMSIRIIMEPLAVGVSSNKHNHLRQVALEAEKALN